jgi:mRNA-degrading endonuclease RelE of RelBE toxin-antitoxin system
MEQDPFSGDVVRLMAQPVAWRRRVGDWRILFDVEPERRRVLVYDILRRTSTTYRSAR